MTGRIGTTMVVLLMLGATATSAVAQEGHKRGRRGGDHRAAEEGALKVGDVAPTFKLKSLDGKVETDLATFSGKRPVVLFFGSYT